MTPMRPGGIVAAVAAVLLFACAPVPRQSAAPPPPNLPPPLPGEDTRSARIFRLDLAAELVGPTGAIDERQGTGQALRIGWFGTNITRYVGFGGSFKMVQTSSEREDTPLFLDMVGMYLRVAVPVLPQVPQLKGFGELEPSMVGMHIPCGPDTIVCNDEGNEFVLRLGVTGRAGAIYEVVPDRLDLNGYLILERTFPDEGGWIGIGAGLTIHYGPTHRTMAQRRQWMQMQQAK